MSQHKLIMTEGTEHKGTVSLEQGHQDDFCSTAETLTKMRPWRRRDGSLMLLNPMWVVEAAEPEHSGLKRSLFRERGVGSH